MNYDNRNDYLQVCIRMIAWWFCDFHYIPLFIIRVHKGIFVLLYFIYLLVSNFEL